jgi:hypothetical protein
MPVRSDDIKEYTDFLQKIAATLGAFDFKHDILVWHYTSGPGLLGIIESGTIYSTQVSCLNDSSEIRYASSLYRSALLALLPNYASNEAVRSFLQYYLTLMDEEPERPNHAPSPFFVACFSAEEDDLTQWRSYCGGENGYAIGFPISKLFGSTSNSLVVRVNYDRSVHENLAREAAEATVRFFEKGIAENRSETPAKWQEEFLTFWDPFISRLAPLVKDPGFKSENEYRIIHEFQTSQLTDMQFLQKKSMLSRHIALTFPLGGEAWVPRLPIEKVLVGPCRHREITRISVDTLMRKMGYASGKVFSSQRPFQEP